MNSAVPWSSRCSRSVAWGRSPVVTSLKDRFNAAAGSGSIEMAERSVTTRSIRSSGSRKTSRKCRAEWNAGFDFRDSTTSSKMMSWRPTASKRLPVLSTDRFIRFSPSFVFGRLVSRRLVFGLFRSFRLMASERRPRRHSFGDKRQRPPSTWVAVCRWSPFPVPLKPRPANP